MRYTFTFGVVAILAIVSACGGNNSSGGDDAPSESGLRETVEEYTEALQDNETSKAYSYQHSSFKEACELEDFAGLMLLSTAFLGDEWQDAELRIDRVNIDGNRGTVEGDLYADDRPLGFGGGGSFWLYEDGKWWRASDEPDPCGLES